MFFIKKKFDWERKTYPPPPPLNDPPLRYDGPDRYSNIYIFILVLDISCDCRTCMCELYAYTYRLNWAMRTF